MARNCTVRLISESKVQFDTEGGQRMAVLLPRGTKIQLPLEWIYGGMPPDAVYTSDLLEENHG